MEKKTLNFLNKYIDENFSNKTILITGGNSGIGFEATKICAFLKMKIFWGIRNLDKGKESENQLRKEFPDVSLNIIQLDLASLKSIKNFVNHLQETNLFFDYIYNNAGVYRMSKLYTKDGIDLTIGTNFIGTYYLTSLLTNIYEGKKVKFIFTSSVTAHLYNIDYSNFFMEKNYKKFKAYCYSKRDIVHMEKFFLEKFKNSNFSFNLIHPGSTYTPLIDKGYKSKTIRKLGSGFMKIFFHSAENAALCAIFSLLEKNNNSYIGPKRFFGLTGNPKLKKLPKNLYKNYLKTIEVADKTIEDILSSR